MAPYPDMHLMIETTPACGLMDRQIKPDLQGTFSSPHAAL